MTERLGAIYPYTDLRGSPVLRKIRREGWEERGRKYRQEAAVISRGRVYWKGGRGCFERHQSDWASKAMYNLPALISSLRVDEPIWFPEGERDCDTGTALFKLATTTNWQGASDFTPEQAEWFTWYGSASRINLLLDNDDAGHAAGRMRRRRLIAAGVEPKRIRLWRPEDPAHKDLTDVALSGLGLGAYVRVRSREVRERADAYAAQVREAIRVGEVRSGEQFYQSVGRSLRRG